MGLAEKTNDADDDMPPPDPALTFVGLYFVACLRTMERMEKREFRAPGFRAAFAEEMERGWAEVESEAAVIRLRSPHQAREMQRVAHQARLWFDRLMEAREAADVLRLR